MVIAACLFLFLPLTLLAVVMNTAAAIQMRHAERRGKQVVAIVRGVLIALWLAACLCAIAARIPHRDWIQLFWSTQIPLLGIFFGSGALLCSTWRVDAWAVNREPGVISSRRSPWFMNGALLFLAMSVTLALLPLALQLVWPEDVPSARETGAPVDALIDLATWGFGGALPTTLAPLTAAEIERGVGHLPREVTVPMGMILTAAWLWIAFTAIAIAGRALRSRRMRIVTYLLAPIALALLSELAQHVLPLRTGTFFDPRFFGPESSRDSGIWTCEPAVVHSFGPVVLAALICAALLGVLLALERVRSVPVPRPAGETFPAS